MRRLIPHLIDRPELDHFAKIHHQHAVGDITHDVEIVADEEIGQAKLALEIGQKIKHLRFDRLVQRRYRFVQDYQARRQRQRPGDVDALALAAGNLVRIAVGESFGTQSDLAEQFARQCPRRVVARAVNPGAERDRFLDGQARIERGVGVLEHHLHAAAQFAQRQGPTDLHAVIDDVAGIARHQVHQQPRGGRLAAAGLADDPDGFALGDGERYVIDRPHRPALGEQAAAHGKVLGQAIDLKQRLRSGAAEILDRLQPIPDRL